MNKLSIINILFALVAAVGQAQPMEHQEQSFACITSAESQQKKTDSQDISSDCPGWLWQISGNGLAQKSYLFGTCHGEGHNFTRDEVFSFPARSLAISQQFVSLIANWVRSLIASKRVHC